jgi:glyoxylase-like metal-dependent hydrolase (beta-lactamase superfamily II)
MLNLHHIRGNTYAIETGMAFLPVYKLNDRDIVLLDSGFASTDRQALTETLQAHDFQVKGILCSHAHMDHAGNIQHLCDLYGCRVGAHLIEAAIALTSDSFRRNFGIYTSEDHGGKEECFTTTDMIMPGQTSLEFCGATFGILHLPGHSGGHIGIVTPDEVAYLGDALMDFPQLAASKMPTTQFLRLDLESKRSLYDVQAKAYVVAHKAVFEDIHPLIDANLRCLETKLQQVLDALQGTPTGGEWLIAYCEGQGWKVRSERSFAILEYGFNSMVTYLEETGKVVSRRVNGNRRFLRK